MGQIISSVDVNIFLILLSFPRKRNRRVLARRSDQFTPFVLLRGPEGNRMI